MKLKIGLFETFTKTITESDIYNFAGISGDLNPIHINEQYAEKTIFHKRIAHGCLINGLISSVIGMKLPGPGTIYLSQNSKFVAPVYIQDTITAKVSVKECLNEAKGIYILETIAYNQNKQNVIEGEAVIKYKEEI